MKNNEILTENDLFFETSRKDSFSSGANDWRSWSQVELDLLYPMVYDLISKYKV